MCGLCFCVNESWCNNSTITGAYCSADLEYLFIKCRPFSSSMKFTYIIPVTVYAKIVMKDSNETNSKLQTLHPDGVFIVAGE